MTILSTASLTRALDIARERVVASLEPTPLITHPLLDRVLDARVLVKLENTTPIGAFKLRGALNLVAGLSPAHRARGLCAPTRGNHGQALAWAARREGMSCTLFVPEGNNPGKNAAMRALGAEVRVVGEDFEATARASSAFASLSGAREVHPGRDRDLILGAATLFLEMFEQAGEPLDVLFVPVGVGSCLAGAVLAKRACGLPARLVGVQAAAAPAMALAIQGSNQTAYPPTPTIADGLAVGAPVTETLELLRGNVQEMVLVSEQELLKAMQLYASTLHQLAEGAGAAALAGAVRLRESLKGQRVGLVLSGGNVDMHTLRQIFQ